MRGRITVSLKNVQKSLTSSIGAMESIKSDVNVANVQCFYPLEANIETTGQCCILLGSEFNFVRSVRIYLPSEINHLVDQHGSKKVPYYRSLIDLHLFLCFTVKFLK